MKILLLFPPDWLPSEPYLSLPALTSVLRPAGHEVAQKDINVEMYEMMFGETFLRHVQKRLGRELLHLQHVEKNQGLNEEEKELMDQLLACTEERFLQLIKDVEKDLNVLQFYLDSLRPSIILSFKIPEILFASSRVSYCHSIKSI